MDASVKISVIVVFQNAEHTIERMLESFDRQNLDGVEYIFVDDGSRDRSVEVLRVGMVVYPSVARAHHLISLPWPRGTAYATSSGMSVASGEYVMRCDADDYLEPDALRLMWEGSENGKMDMVVAPYYRVEVGKRRLVTWRKVCAGLNDMPIDTLHFSLCNRLLRRSLIVSNNLEPFAGVDFWEDLGVVVRYLTYDPSIAYLQSPTYNYVRGSESLTQRAKLLENVKERVLQEHLTMALLIEQWMVNRGIADRYEEFLTRLKFIAKVKYLRGKYKDVEKWKQTFPEVNSRIMSIRGVGYHWRLLFRLVAVLPTSFTQWVANTVARFYR